jgi:hypothetical protein
MFLGQFYDFSVAHDTMQKSLGKSIVLLLKKLEITGRKNFLEASKMLYCLELSNIVMFAKKI